MPINIIVPPLSQTMDTLTFLEWHKQPGEEIEKGEVLFSVETDKATQDVEAPASGTIYELYAQPDQEVDVRSVIGIILAEGEKLPDSARRQDNKGKPVDLEIKRGNTFAANELRPKGPSQKNERLFASPRARRLAAEKGLDLSLASASGPRDMVVERDLIRLMQEKSSDEPVPLSQIRQIIAERMLNSHLNTAPVTYMSEVDAKGLVDRRESLLTELAARNLRPTYTDILVHIACRALQIHPELNASFENRQYIMHREINIGLAVETKRGLIVPVLHNAQKMDIAQISLARKQLVTRARSGEITPDELSGGTFTISNLGASGIDYFTPIINPPQVAILAVGRIRQVPYVLNGGIHIRSVVSLGVTCDHRVIDGVPAARFLNAVSLLIGEQTIKD